MRLCQTRVNASSGSLRSAVAVPRACPPLCALFMSRQSEVLPDVLVDASYAATASSKSHSSSTCSRAPLCALDASGGRRAFQWASLMEGNLQVCCRRPICLCQCVPCLLHCLCLKGVPLHHLLGAHRGCRRLFSQRQPRACKARRGTASIWQQRSRTTLALRHRTSWTLGEATKTGRLASDEPETPWYSIRKRKEPHVCCLLLRRHPAPSDLPIQAFSWPYGTPSSQYYII